MAKLLHLDVIFKYNGEDSAEEATEKFYEIFNEEREDIKYLKITIEEEEENR